VIRERPTVEESAKKCNTDTVKKAFIKTGGLLYKITVNIGDWSNDGHGKTEDFVYGCNKPLKSIAAAYKKAAKKLPEVIHPINVFEHYEDKSLTAEAYFAMFDAGYDMLAGFNNAKERVRREKHLKDETWEDILQYPQVGPDEFSLYILWFCQQGDPGLVFSKESSEKLFGYGGITENVGYGLFT
jgi:hypothetical protein